MKRLIPALWLVVSFTAGASFMAGAAVAQPYSPNEAGVTNGHWHLNSHLVDVDKKLFLTLGAAPGEVSSTQRVVFPGVLVILNQAAGTPPPTGGSEGSVVNHVGFTVQNLDEAVAKWKAAGITVAPNSSGKPGWIYTPDGLRVEIQEDKTQTVPIRSKHVHFFMPESSFAESQAWYAKIFGAKPGMNGAMPIADLPGVQLRWGKANAPQAPTKGRILDHIAFDVTDLKAFIARLEAAGVKLDQPYTKNAAGVGIIFITDPWGTRIEVNERPGAVYLP